MTNKLRFDGVQEGFRDIPDVPLFTILDPGHPSFKSTVGPETARQLGFTDEEMIQARMQAAYMAEGGENHAR